MKIPVLQTRLRGVKEYDIYKILKDEDEKRLIRENVRLIRDRLPSLIRERNKLFREKNL